MRNCAWAVVAFWLMKGTGQIEEKQRISAMSAASATVLRSHFGFGKFRPGQEEAIENLTSGKHTLVVMPTGAGKSLVYQLAALQLGGLTLVLSPLISLMRDQVDALTRRRIPATFINSSLSQAEQSRRLADTVAGRYRLVYVAPERLLSVAFQQALSNLHLNLLAVDEAHCVSEWGHDFRPDYLRIAEVRRKLGSPVTAALTATATVRVQDEIIRLLELSSAEGVITGFNRPNLSFEVRYAGDSRSKLLLLRRLLSEESGIPAIVYCGTRRDSEEVAAFVSEALGIEALAYHAGLEDGSRDRVQAAFMNGDVPVVAATCAFGMGIDRQDVRLVVHFSLPGTLEAYYQEAGRAGRDGDPARAVLLYAPQDRSLQEFFIESDAFDEDDLSHVYQALTTCVKDETWVDPDNLSRATGFGETRQRLALAGLEKAGMLQRLGDEGRAMLVSLGGWHPEEAKRAVAAARQRQDFRLRQLDLMVGYGETDKCRRRIILDHFGDSSLGAADDCCDNCRSRAVARVVKDTPREFSTLPQNEKTALVILDALRRLNWSVGRTKLGDLLVGSKSRAMRECGYDHSPYYGRLARFKREDVMDMLQQLVEMRYLQASSDRFRPVLKLTDLGEEAIRLRASIPLRLPRSASVPPARYGKKAQHSVSSAALTYQMFSENMVPEAIAAERNLSISTVYAHLALFIAQGGLQIESVVSPDRVAAIRVAIEQIGNAEALSPVKELLPDEVTYHEIRCVAEDWKREHSAGADASNIRKAILECVRAHPGELPRSRIADLLTGAHVERLGEWRRGPFFKNLSGDKSGTVLRAIDDLIEDGQIKLDDRRKVWPAWDTAYQGAHEDDLVGRFLSRSHPQKLSGPWECGWALGFYSSFSGNEWSRSRVGDLVHRLKYEGETEALLPLVSEALALIEAHPEFSRVDGVVATPPTVVREFDHVAAFARLLADRLRLPVLAAIEKTRHTRPQKDFRTLAEKKHNVAGAYQSRECVRGRRLLLVDDLFDSGMSLEEMTQTLLRAGAKGVVVLTMTRTIHSDD